MGNKDLADYLLDNYGLCKLDVCICIQPIKRTSPVEFPPWLGRLCPNWQPSGALTNNDLLDIRKVYE